MPVCKHGTPLIPHTRIAPSRAYNSQQDYLPRIMCSSQESICKSSIKQSVFFSFPIITHTSGLYWLGYKSTFQVCSCTGLLRRWGKAILKPRLLVNISAQSSVGFDWNGVYANQIKQYFAPVTIHRELWKWIPSHHMLREDFLVTSLCF